MSHRTYLYIFKKYALTRYANYLNFFFNASNFA